MPHPVSPESAKCMTIHSAESDKIKPTETARDNTPRLGQNKPRVADEKVFTNKTILLIASVFLSMFLVAVDRTIISTAIPVITDEFNSLSDIGWYGSMYLITCCAFQLLFGKLYSFYSVKVVLITSIVVFEVASAICGAASNSPTFITGRAITGVGTAGIFGGTIMSIVHAVPLQKRPKVQSLMGAIMGMATVVGPLIGGGLTSNVSWRWCFYINLPLDKLSQLDIPGTIVLVPGVICLLLALQWGGQTYAWSSARIIALLTLMAVLLVAFITIQIFLPKTATIPPSILKYRSVAASVWSTIFIGSSQYIFEPNSNKGYVMYYLPIWFKSIKGVAAVESGIRLLPQMIAFVLASISGGFLNQKIGYYTPLGIAGASMMSIGAGLLTTLQINTTAGKWIGYEILYGYGMGLCFQTPNLATQTVLPKSEVPMGMVLMFFSQLLGAAVFVSVGENVLANQLLQRLADIPGFNKKLVTAGGATFLVRSVPADAKEKVLTAYNEALRKVFQIGLIVSCLAVLGTVSMEWKSILKKPQADVDGKKGGAGDPSNAQSSEGNGARPQKERRRGGKEGGRDRLK
ncbi:MDR family MFS transporter [Aspergillus tanneri]|uniref:Major facilitator superfamily (MFS) profile domain-containing protein n=1 Tax=Aspergillus tanneri TaxID=1220188 RepID=A0A5M9MFL4_9EURO|nr:uncharacterized protein ATNIH1004_010537 [Aspergillus tanneri]KAA8643763.1 hypothetical protein ATNIH1004_010537 [Aspergillus tanneri]